MPRRGGYHGNKKLRCKCRRVPCSLVSRIVAASICIGRLVKNSGGEINREDGFRKSRSFPLAATPRTGYTNRVVIFVRVDRCIQRKKWFWFLQNNFVESFAFLCLYTRGVNIIDITV